MSADDTAAIDRHFHWQFVAYDGEPKAEKTSWAVYVEVIGYDGEADALIAAQAVVTRQQYGLVRVWECAACGFQRQQARSMQALAKAAGGAS